MRYLVTRTEHRWNPGHPRCTPEGRGAGLDRLAPSLRQQRRAVRAWLSPPSPLGNLRPTPLLIKTLFLPRFPTTPAPGPYTPPSRECAGPAPPPTLPGRDSMQSRAGQRYNRPGLLPGGSRPQNSHNTLQDTTGSSSPAYLPRALQTQPGDPA